MLGFPGRFRARQCCGESQSAQLGIGIRGCACSGAFSEELGLAGVLTTWVPVGVQVPDIFANNLLLHKKWFKHQELMLHTIQCGLQANAQLS